MQIFKRDPKFFINASAQTLQEYANESGQLVFVETMPLYGKCVAIVAEDFSSSILYTEQSQIAKQYGVSDEIICTLRLLGKNIHDVRFQLELSCKVGPDFKILYSSESHDTWSLYNFDGVLLTTSAKVSELIFAAGLQENPIAKFLSEAGLYKEPEQIPVPVVTPVTPTSELDTLFAKLPKNLQEQFKGTLEELVKRSEQSNTPPKVDPKHSKETVKAPSPKVTAKAQTKAPAKSVVNTWQIFRKLKKAGATWKEYDGPTTASKETMQGLIDYLNSSDKGAYFKAEKVS